MLQENNDKNNGGYVKLERLSWRRSSSKTSGKLTLHKNEQAIEVRYHTKSFLKRLKVQ